MLSGSGMCLPRRESSQRPACPLRGGRRYPALCHLPPAAVWSAEPDSLCGWVPEGAGAASPHTSPCNTTMPFPHTAHPERGLGPWPHSPLTHSEQDSICLSVSLLCESFSVSIFLLLSESLSSCHSFYPHLSSLSL
uniref:Uncharacterized protein n=1 Tax=Pipistrellus kuhlii TaxID=59472 RepID=A0A7J7S6D6_PIPKU|nr:hypothetical protein mPipKuh1_010017 [Pipistrellus kuhlii]